MLTSRRRRRPAPISLATLVVLDGAGLFVVERPLKAPNRSYWAHWTVKHRDRAGWEATLKTALVDHLDRALRDAFERRDLAVLALTNGPLPPAPQQRYRVEITRVIPRLGHAITDEDNLAFSVKPLLDALVSLGIIFSDRREWLDRPLPQQRVEPRRTATEIRITPWWRAQPAHAGHLTAPQVASQP